MSDSFSARGNLDVGGKSYEIYRLNALESDYKVSRLPYSMKILLENLLRNENGKDVTADDIKAVAPAVLRHRIVLSYESEADGITTDAVIEQLLQRIPVP